MLNLQFIFPVVTSFFNKYNLISLEINYIKFNILRFKNIY